MPAKASVRSPGVAPLGCGPEPPEGGDAGALVGLRRPDDQMTSPVPPSSRAGPLGMLKSPSATIARANEKGLPRWDSAR